MKTTGDASLPQPVGSASARAKCLRQLFAPCRMLCGSSLICLQPLCVVARSHRSLAASHDPCMYGRFPKCHRVLLGRDPDWNPTSCQKKHPQLNCSDLRLSNWKIEDWNYGNRPYANLMRVGRSSRTWRSCCRRASWSDGYMACLSGCPELFSPMPNATM